jgi:hypothetical protein
MSSDCYYDVFSLFPRARESGHGFRGFRHGFRGFLKKKKLARGIRYIFKKTMAETTKQEVPKFSQGDHARPETRGITSIWIATVSTMLMIRMLCPSFAEVCSENSEEFMFLQYSFFSKGLR